jgi:hypothetical protein
MSQVKNPVAVGWKLESQYAMTENIVAMRTRDKVSLHRIPRWCLSRNHIHR